MREPTPEEIKRVHAKETTAPVRQGSQMERALANIAGEPLSPEIATGWLDRIREQKLISPEIDSENLRRNPNIFAKLDTKLKTEKFESDLSIKEMERDLVERGGAYQLGTGKDHVTIPNNWKPKPSKVPDAVLFKIQNVHDYFMQHADEHKWYDPNSFSSVRLPYDKIVLSYDHEFKIPNPGDPPDKGSQKIVRHVTVSMETHTRIEAMAEIFKCELSENDRRELLHVIERREPDSFIKTRMAMDGMQYPGTWELMLDETGHPLTDEIHSQNWLWIRNPKETEIVATFEKNAGRPIDDAFARQGMICLTAVQFLNCKNVEILDNPPSRQQRRFAERQGTKPPVTYKTLVIHPMGRRRQGATETGDSEGARKALHIVRGHFKDYNEKGLGRAHTRGVFWWSPQVRGSAEHGRVEKDYDVQAEAQ